MIDPQAKLKPYLRLLALIAVLGLVGAVVTFLFIALSDLGIDLVWDQIASAVGVADWLFTLFICTLGGLIVGLLVKLFGDHNAIFAELMQEFGKTGRFNYRHVPGIVVTSLVSLIVGGSLGPEAALADASGGIGTWLSDKLKLDERETRTMGFGGLSAMLAAFITNPFAGPLLALESAQGGTSGRQVYFWSLLPSLLASAVATFVFVALSGSYFAALYTFPDYTPRLRDLLIAVPLSAVGAMASILFWMIFRALRRLMVPLNQRLVLRGLIGGLGMGIIGALLPLTLFSGEDQTLDLIQDAGEIGFWMLILLAISKLFATSLLLATGWKGGYIFPIMFAGVALGLACDTFLPGVSIAATVAAVLAGALVAALRAPLFAALFTLALVDVATMPVVAVAVVVSALITALLAMRDAREKESEEPAVGGSEK